MGCQAGWPIRIRPGAPRFSKITHLVPGGYPVATVICTENLYAERATFCSNCGDSVDSPARPCPKPSPGVPLVDCGRGGHMFNQTEEQRWAAVWSDTEER
jgi:hypothetical protein